MRCESIHQLQSVCELKDTNDGDCTEGKNHVVFAIIDERDNLVILDS